MNWVNIELHFV